MAVQELSTSSAHQGCTENEFTAYGKRETEKMTPEFTRKLQKTEFRALLRKYNPWLYNAPLTSWPATDQPDCCCCWSRGVVVGGGDQQSACGVQQLEQHEGDERKEDREVVAAE